MTLRTFLKKVRILRCDAGAAMIEFALLLPPLILTWMGMIELGRYMAYATLAQAAARAGTEYGIINLMYGKDLTNTTSWATSDAQYLPSGFTVTSKYLCSVNGALPPTTCTFSKTGPPVNNDYYIEVIVSGTYGPWFTYPGMASSVKVYGITYTLVSDQ
jgi:Flp pilus assembly protein TadG